MTSSLRPHADEGGEAPCFAHLLEEPTFVPDRLLDLATDAVPGRAEEAASDDGGPPQSER